MSAPCDNLEHPVTVGADGWNRCLAPRCGKRWRNMVGHTHLDGLLADEPAVRP